METHGKKRLWLEEIVHILSTQELSYQRNQESLPSTSGGNTCLATKLQLSPKVGKNKAFLIPNFLPASIHDISTCNASK